MKPTVSVIVPAYNAAATISRALGSITAQNTEHGLMEIIVVDDGSRDETPAIVESIALDADLCIRLIRQKNSGPAAARNRGAAEARGEYIAFLDADDEWMDGKIEAQLRLLRTRHTAELLSCGMNARAFRCKPGIFELGFRELLFSNIIYTSSVLVRTAAFREVGGFDPRRRLSEDFELWLRLARRRPLVVLNKPLLRYAPGGISARLWPMERGELETYRIMYREGNISCFLHSALRFLSLSKYCFRTLMNALNRRQ